MPARRTPCRTVSNGSAPNPQVRDEFPARLEVIKRMKPLGFALEEMRELPTLLADLDAGTEDRAQLLDRLRMFHEAATARVTALREQLTVAEGFADSLAGHLDARR